MSVTSFAWGLFACIAFVTVVAYRAGAISRAALFGILIVASAWILPIFHLHETIVP
jgi:hypothetical protein